MPLDEIGKDFLQENTRKPIFCTCSQDQVQSHVPLVLKMLLGLQTNYSFLVTYPRKEETQGDAGWHKAKQGDARRRKPDFGQ